MKKLFSMLIILTLSLFSFAQAETTLEDLKASFALDIETEGLTAEELTARGRAYETGDGVVRWYAMAKAYYEAAGAQEELAALEAYRQQVMDNSPNAQGEVFTFFRTGMTASQQGNYEQAYAVYYDDAFFFEDPLLRGIGSLGDLLRDGTGVERDIDKAVAIYTFNAEVLGKGNGYTSLGLLYQAEDGAYPGITHSTDRALEYFLLSYQGENLKETDFKGPRYAADMFDAGYTTDAGEAVAPDYVKAEEGYLIAAAGNGRTFDGTACYKLACYYDEGRESIEQNAEKAVEYYLKAVSDPNTHATMLGIPQTYLALGKHYEAGAGVEKDIETAYAYYQKALEAADENIALVNAAGNEAAYAVHDEAEEAIERLNGLRTTVEASDMSATGYIVTFRYVDADAERVRLKGNFLFTDYLHASLRTSLNAAPDQWADGMFNYGDDLYIDMVRDESTGVWSVSLPLPNNTYSYNFYVGGSAEDAVNDVSNAVKKDDPVNPCLVTGFEKEGAEPGSSSIYVPRDDEKQANSIDLTVEAPNPEKAGTIVWASVDFNGMTAPFGVYLPNGYNAKGSETYPVLVMAHGGGGNHANWFNDGLANILDNLIAGGKMDPTIVVTPNWQILGFKTTPETCEQYYDLLANYILPYVTENYRAAEDAAHRAIGGLSMGGARTMYLAYYHPDIADYFFAYSAPWVDGAHQEPALNAADYEGKTIFLGCGLYDSVKVNCYLTEPTQWSAGESSTYKHTYTLADAGIPFFSAHEPPYGHSWQTWRQLAACSLENLLWK